MKLIPISSLHKKSLKIPMGDQNLYIEEELTTQWPQKVQKDKQGSTKHTHKTKETGGELRCSGTVRVSSPLVAPI